MSMAISAGMKFAQYAEKISDGMRDELYRRGVQITQVLRKTELEVLAGARMVSNIRVCQTALLLPEKRLRHSRGSCGRNGTISQKDKATAIRVL